MAFRSELRYTDGDDLDDYTSSEPKWSPGDVLYAGGSPAYHIRSVIPMDDHGNEVYQSISESRSCRA